MHSQGHPVAHSAGQVPVYVWQAPGGEISIHLSLDVVRRLRAALGAAANGADRIPEIGGLLLGATQAGEPILTTVEDFELFPSAHTRGASYTLVASERAALDKKIRQRGRGRGLKAVGWFRSHSRPGLYMDQSDLAVMSELFGAAADVALLIGAQPGSDAGFFFWENGDIRRQASYRTFPFDATVLASGGHRVVRKFEPPLPAEGEHIPHRNAENEAAVAGRTPEPRAARPRVVEPLPSALGPSWMRPRVWVVGAGIAALMVASGLGLRKAFNIQPAARLEQAPSLALRVEKSSGGLKLMWDRNSRLIEHARRAVVHITDGGNPYSLDLTSSQLALGSVMYFANAPDVAFELVVSGPEGESRESLRTFAPLPHPTEAAREWSGEVPGLPPAGTPGALTDALPDESREEPVMRASRTVRRPAPREFAGLTAPSRDIAAPMLQPPPALDVTTAFNTDAVAAFAHSRYRKASVTVKPAKASGLLGKIPLLRRLQKRPREEEAGFVSARPVHQVAPAVPPSLEVAQDVDVKVRIDETGEVAGTEVLTKGAEDMLANAAVSAARDWRFEPAQRNGRDVPSELVLRFQFQR